MVSFCAIPDHNFACNVVYMLNRLAIIKHFLKSIAVFLGGLVKRYEIGEGTSTVIYVNSEWRSKHYYRLTDTTSAHSLIP